MDLSKNFKDSIDLRIETIVMMSPSFVTKEACKIKAAGAVQTSFLKFEKFTL